MFLVLTLLSCFSVLFQHCHGAKCTQDRAVKLWMVKSFIDTYLNMDQNTSSNNSIIVGRIIYNTLKYMGYNEQSKTGALFDVPVEQLSAQIDDWQHQEFISANDAQQAKLELYASHSHHVLKEILFDRNGVEQVYGLNGFIKLSENRGASIFTFFIFRLRRTGTKRTKRDILPQILDTLSGILKYTNWTSITGQIVTSNFFAKQMENMMTYIRYRALKNLYDQNGGFLNGLLKEYDTCRSSLPFNVSANGQP